MSANDISNQTFSSSSVPYAGFPFTQNRAFIFIVLFSSVICNGTVVYLVLVRLRKANLLRKSNLLITHMALASILFFTSTLFVTTEKTGPINVHEEVCAEVAYIKRLFHTVYLANAFAFTYERLSALKQNQSSTKSGWIIAVVWIVSLGFSVPAAFTTISRTNYILSFESNITTAKSTSTQENCRAINFLQSESATLAYELARLMVFGIANSAYMLYAVFEIRSIVKNMRQVQGTALTTRMARKLRSVRLIYVIFILFVLISVPNEIRISLLRVLARYKLKYFDASVIRNFLWSPYAFGFYIGGYLYNILMPFVSLVMLEGKAAFGCCGSRDAADDGNETADLPSRENEAQRLQPCTSRVSTAQNSPTTLKTSSM